MWPSWCFPRILYAYQYIEESTELLYYGEGSEEMARIAFHMEPKDGVFDLKGVVSRKKQLIPALMEAAQAGQNDYN